MKALRWFLGLTRYYRKFIRSYGSLVLLTELLGKICFNWNEEADATFKQLKEAKTTTPVLSLPDFSQPFSIECDASTWSLTARRSPHCIF